MSGGSYDYFFGRVNDMADSLRNVDSDPRRTAFKKLLRLVSDALHDIEWVDSCDYAEGDDHKAIDAVFGFLGKDPNLVYKAAAYEGLKVTLQQYFKDAKEHPTPKEKAELAYEKIQKTVTLNDAICKIGACIHKEHQK